MKNNTDLLKTVYKALGGDEDAALAILSKKKGLIYSYICRNLAAKYYSHIDDIFQEVCINFINAIKKGKIREPNKIGSFIIGLTIKTTRSYYKKEIKKHNKIKEELTKFMKSSKKEFVNIQDDIEKKELLEKLTHSVDRLSAMDRKLIIMRFFEEMTFEEIGKIFNISTATAKRRFDKAMERLNNIVSEVDN